MNKYPKIMTIFKRDEKSKHIVPIIRQDYAILALEYLNGIICEEKIDGTNAQIEIYYNASANEEPEILFYSRNNVIKDCDICKGGKEKSMYLTNPPTEKTCPKCKGKGYIDIMCIRETLERIVDLKKLKKWYYNALCLDKEGNIKEEGAIVRIFGEVFGGGINKGGKYCGDQVKDFREFDIQVGNSFLSPKDRNDICNKVGLKAVPKILELVKLPNYRDFRHFLCRTHNKSLLAKEYGKDCLLEGYILRPKISLYTNKKRVIGKIKVRDYKGKDKNNERPKKNR